MRHTSGTSTRGRRLVGASPSCGTRGTGLRSGKCGRVEVSYDDGATWQRSDAERRGAAWRTSLKAPKKAGFVSLRVTARASAGNSVAQTITRAFGLR
ncbi:hypothetical protein [Streptomyces erythrochromogenes]|uniref:hypothetical protein n=1 Tax=Streptomyces erythrochromogenes TaxID=285574 RepID=UPI00382F8A42